MRVLRNSSNIESMIRQSDRSMRGLAMFTRSFVDFDNQIANQLMAPRESA